MRLFSIVCASGMVCACNSLQKSVRADAGAPEITHSAAAIPPAPTTHMGRRHLTVHEALDAWNDAHNKHDARALEVLYAARVAFYATTQTNEDCVAKKAAAFAKAPDFTQSLSNIKFNSDDPARQAKEFTLVTFRKTSTIGGKSTTVSASLGVAPDGLITFESDGPTTDKLYKAWFEAESWCTRPGDAPNDTIIAPYKLSAKDARARILRSKRWAELQNEDDATAPDVFFKCPTACDQSVRDGCGYEMGVVNGNDNRFLRTVLYVDAVNGDVLDLNIPDSKPEHVAALSGEADL